MAYTLYFIMHTTTGTPKPVESTLYPMLVSLFLTSPTTTYILRRGYMRQNKSRPAVKDRTWKKKQARMQQPPPQMETVAEVIDTNDDN